MDLDKDLIQRLLAAAGLAGTAGAIRALVTTDKIMQKVRTLFATILTGLLLGYLLQGTHFSKTIQDIIIILGALFIDKIWPMLEKFVLKFVNKKGNEYISGSNFGKHITGTDSNSGANKYDEKI